MVKMHATRLMPNGEVALWSKGQLIWSGVVGAHVSSMSFDAISMHVDDSVRCSQQLAITRPPISC